MTPEPGKDHIVSKIIIIGVALILLLIMGACVFVIYNYLQPQDSAPSSTSTPSPLPTITPTPMPTYTPTPTTRPNATSTSIPDSGYIQDDAKVTTGDFQFTYPGIWNNYIVYDMYDGQKNYTILYDANSKTRTQIDTGWVFSDGTISDGKVMLYKPSGNTITLYDIATRQFAVTSTNENKNRGSFAMSGSKLAYYQDNGNYDANHVWNPDYSIFVFSTVDGTNSNVMSNLPRPLDISIDGDKLVYTVVNGQGSDVYLLDLSQRSIVPKKISTRQGNNNHARISGRYIVYYSDVDGGDHIYVYDITTGQTFEPAPDSLQSSADIYGNTVVYDDNRNGNWDIYAYDMSTKAERRITNESHDQRNPVIYGNRIAYMDNRNGIWDIYTMTI